MKKKILKICGIVLVSLIAIVFIFAKVNRVVPLVWNSKEFNQPMFSDLAMNGYDPVSYFIERKAVKGDDAISYKWNNATWYFLTIDHKKMFEEAPEKYIPKYGGFCSFAISKGFTANSNPSTFIFIDGELYLFADEGVKKKWLSNQSKNLELSNKNWN